MKQISRGIRRLLEPAFRRLPRGGQALVAAGLLAIAATGAAIQSGNAEPGLPKPALTPDSTLPPLSPGPNRTAGQGSSSARIISKADLEPWLDGLMQDALVRGDMAGGVVVVVKDGQILLAKGYGEADVERKTPASSRNSLFRVGSITKLFTATAVMQLVENGRLDLDRDVNAYLDFRIPARSGGPITLRTMLTHRAGFEEAYKGLIRTDIEQLEPLGERLKRWVPRRIYAAGTTPAYSNYSAALAGYIVERQSGLPFETYVERNILKPLGMSRSTMRQPVPPPLATDLSKGYAAASAGTQPFEFITLAPAGALSATGDDMARFMLAHLPPTNPAAPRLLDDVTLAEMHNSRANGIGPLRRMRIGFYESDVNGRQVLAHSGDTLAFHSDMNLFPDERTGIFLALNSGGKDGAAYSLRPFLLQAFADRYFPGAASDAASFRRSVAPSQLSTAARRQHALMIAGVYQNTRRAESNFMSILSLFGQTEIQPDGDGSLQIAGFEDAAGNLRLWREVRPFVWTDATGSQRLAAEVRGGKVVRVSADEMAPIMALDRVAWWQSAGLLVPAIWISVGLLALTVAAWPVWAIYRRRHGVPGLRGPRLRRALLFARLGAVAVLLSLAAWFQTITSMASDLNLMSPGLDPWLLMLSLIEIVALATAALAAGYYHHASWHSEAAWLDRAWSAVLALSLIVIGWISFSFELLSFSTNY